MGKYGININISGISYEVDLKDMKDFDFEEYNYLLDVLNDKNLSTIGQYKKLLFLFSGLDEDIIDNVNNITKINFGEILAQEIRCKKINPRFTGYKLKNGLEKQDFNEIYIGKFIDFEYFLTNKNYDKKIQMICALMYSGNDYNMDKLNKMVEDITDILSIGNALTFYEEFIKFRELIYVSYKDLFKINSEDDEEEDEIEVPFEKADEYEKKLKKEEEKKQKIKEDDDNIGLLSLVYMIAEMGVYGTIDEVLEKPLIKILNFCRWKKEQNERENIKTKVR